MAQSAGNPPHTFRLCLALAGVVMVALLLWFAISTKLGGEREDVGTNRENGSEASRPNSDRRHGGIIESPDRTTAGKRPTDSSVSEEGQDGPQFPLVDEILGNDKLSNGEAAARLLEIVNDRNLTILEREEALAHGLNLDFLQFESLVADPTLPQPLAQRFFDEMLNHNEHRDLQVRACIALVDHDDATMREDAAEQLAFYIGLEERSDKPEELKQEAYAFLEDLAKRPKPEPEPLDPDADIPETAPINPSESQEDDDEPDDGE